MRSVRIGDRLWSEVQRCAESEGETVTAVIREALERYVAGKERNRVKRRDRDG